MTVTELNPEAGNSTDCEFRNRTAQEWQELADELEKELDIYKPLYLRWAFKSHRAQIVRLAADKNKGRGQLSPKVPYI